MSKCARCGQRKGKRFCPGIKGEICPRCCGTYRLAEIPCPEDCPYLEGARREEARDQERRKAAIDLYTRERIGEFASPTERQVALIFESIAFEWWLRNRRASVDDIAASYERAGRILGRITLPGDDREPLAAFLTSGADQVPDLRQARESRGSEFLVSILRRLAEFARDYEKRTSPWKGYWRDLEYVCGSIRHPERESRSQAEVSPLILPGRAGRLDPASRWPLILPGER